MILAKQRCCITINLFLFVQRADSNLMEEGSKRQDHALNLKRGYHDEDENQNEDQDEVSDEAPKGKRPRPSTESKVRVPKRLKKEEDSTMSPVKDGKYILQERQKAATWADSMGFGKKLGNLKQPAKVVYHVFY